MSASIKTLIDKSDNEIYPKTKMSAVYDENNNNLSNIINNIKTDLGNPSSASTVSGNDAFSKINKLDSDLANKTNLYKITGASTFYVNMHGNQHASLIIVPLFWFDENQGLIFCSATSQPSYTIANIVGSMASQFSISWQTNTKLKIIHTTTYPGGLSYAIIDLNGYVESVTVS
jgi:hypothetical protein